MNGVNEPRLSWIFFQLLPQPRDVNIDRSRRRRGASDTRIRQRLTDGELIFLTQDEDFLSGEAVAATIVVSRVRQVRSLAERIQVWRTAVQRLVSMDRATRRYELTDDGALVPWSTSSQGG